MAKSGKGTIAEEYIISIIPELNEKKFEDARKKVAEVTKGKTREKSEYQKKKEEIRLEALKSQLQLKNENQIIKNRRELAKNEYLNTKNSTSLDRIARTSSITAMSTFINAAVSAIKLIYDVFDKLTESAKDFSNSMITASSAFVNKNTRQLMATFGVSGQTATGMSSVMNLMGINTSDFAMMTPAQMQLYSKLMQQWKDGMNSIDSTSLEKFQSVMQDFQSEFASAKLELQIQFYKMLVDLAPALEETFTAIIELVKGLGELMSSPMVKTMLTALGSLVTNIVRIVTALSYALSLDFVNAGKALAGVSTGNTTNNYTITSTSNNSYSGDTSSMYALATATQSTETNSILTTLNSTGGT